MTQIPTCPEHLDTPRPSWCHAAFIPAQKCECYRLLPTHLVPTFSDGLALVKHMNMSSAQWVILTSTQQFLPSFLTFAGLGQVTQPEHQLSLASIPGYNMLVPPSHSQAKVNSCSSCTSSVRWVLQIPACPLMPTLWEPRQVVCPRFQPSQPCQHQIPSIQPLLTEPASWPRKAQPEETFSCFLAYH